MRIVAIVAMTLTWIILSENLSIMTVIMGVVFAVACIEISLRLLPLPAVGKINVFRLLIYPFYLIGQIYLAGFSTIKLILRGARIDVVLTKTAISNNFLRMLLANAITLTPGTATLNMEDDQLTILYLKEKKGAGSGDDPADKALENFLIKIQR